MNKAIFITVRTSSKRLPGKCLLLIDKLYNIVRVIYNARKATKADLIVVCTTDLSEDDELHSVAGWCKHPVYRGSSEDKLDRWLKAAEQHNVDFFVTIDADDLLAPAELVDLAFKQYERTQADFIESKDVVWGCFGCGIKVEALRKVCEIKNTSDTEMIGPYFKETGLFKCEYLENIPEVYKRPDLRMTLDYPEDLEFFTEIIGTNGSEFSMRDAIKYIDAHPEVVQINQSLQTKFLANQKEKTKLILK